MSDEKFELSRRSALIGAGTVGIASAGAGLGTTAFFSDQESFEGNEIQAGEFGLKAKQYVKDIDQDGIGPDEQNWSEGDNDKGGLWMQAPIEITDAKPGDSYKFCWKLKVTDNPGYVAATGSYTDENGVDAENVELEDLWDIDDEADLSTIGEEATATLTTKYGDDKTATVEYDNLRSLLDSLASGILVSDKDHEAIRFQPSSWVWVCLSISIPTDVGNEIQGAVTSTDMTFYAEQARHNDPADVLDNAVSELGGA